MLTWCWRTAQFQRRSAAGTVWGGELARLFFNLLRQNLMRYRDILLRVGGICAVRRVDAVAHLRFWQAQYYRAPLTKLASRL